MSINLAIPLPLRSLLEKLKSRGAPRARVLVLAALGFAILMTYATLLATNYLAWRDFSLFLHLSPAVFLLNLLVVLIVFNGCHALTNRWIFSAVLVAYLSAFLIVLHVSKLRVLGLPLVPADIYLVPQFFLLLPHLFSYMGGVLTLLGVSIAASLAILWWLRRFRCLSGSRGYRLSSAACSLGLLAALLGVRLHDPGPVNLGGVFVWTDWNQKENYERNGFFLSSVANLTLFFNPIREPRIYSENMVRAIYQKYVSQSGRAGAPPAAAAEPANVIVVLAEAFCDIDRVGFKMTRDPIPFFHSLQRQGPSGYLRVPTYGGYTAQPEFELLSGFAMAFLPDVSNPYQSYVNLNRKLPTLPNSFKQNKYRTWAVHPYHKYFWDRAKAYPLLGFDEFIDINGFQDARKAGPYISDDVLVDKIVEVSKRSSPYFLFAITMASHGPFTYKDFLKEPLEVTTPLTPDSHDQVKTYINAITRTDAALKKLIEHFAKEPKKTLIVIFGDHMPMLGIEMNTYREVGFLRPLDSIYERMNLTPVVAWANYKLPERPLPKKIHLLLPYILDAAGVKMNGFAKFMDGYARNQPPSFQAGVDASAEFQLVQYDLLFGKQYTLGLDDPARNSTGIVTAIERSAGRKRDFEGLPLLIKEYGPQEFFFGKPFNPQPDGSYAFWFKTENASPETVATINGRELPTTVDRQAITALLPPGLLPGPAVYQLCLFDKAGKRRSAEVPFKLVAAAVTTQTATAAVTPAEPVWPPPVTNWGPRETFAGTDFNVQTHNRLPAIWFILERPCRELAIAMNGRPLELTLGDGNVVTATIPHDLYATPGEFPISIKHLPTGKLSPPLIFKVRPNPAASAGASTATTANPTTATAAR